MIQRTMRLLALGLGVLALAAPARAQELLGVKVERDVVYDRPGGVELRLDAYIPQGAGPFPTVVVIHGGSWRRGKKEQLAIHSFALARAGFAAFAIEYRLAPEHKWPAQIDDCKAAVRWVRANAEERRLDSGRIAAFGYSAGGHLAALLGLASAGDAQVRAVVAGGAPLDLESMPARSTWFADWLGATRAERPALYREASPLAHDVKGAAPMLFFNGGLDVLVPRSDAERMAARLAEAKIASDLLVLPALGHMTAPADPRVMIRSIAFLSAALPRCVLR